MRISNTTTFSISPFFFPFVSTLPDILTIVPEVSRRLALPTLGSHDPTLTSFVSRSTTRCATDACPGDGGRARRSKPCPSVLRESIGFFPSPSLASFSSSCWVSSDAPLFNSRLSLNECGLSCKLLPHVFALLPRLVDPIYIYKSLTHLQSLS